jgi:putative tryptophan/tyrosine transport system substrate-binding protein
MISRRAFIGGLTSGLLATPLAIQAQPGRVYRLGVVLQGGPYLGAVDGLRKGLAELGLEEGKQLILHVRDCKGDLKAAEQAAGDLEREKVDLIYSVGTSVTLAVKRATKTVPIVFYVGGDPVSFGLVESFRKPEGRLTGVYSGFSSNLTAKRLELLKEMVPRLRRVVMFYNPENPAAERGMKEARDAARLMKVELAEHRAASVEELRAGLRALQAGKADAFLSAVDSMVVSQTALVIDIVREKKLPSMFSQQDSVVKGGLASYGVSFEALGRLAARYVQRILLGANPGELPVEQVDRLYFVINLKTAKALGLTIPQSLLQRADEVIQ